MDVLLLFGGVSTEHNISILSAYNIASSLDGNTYSLNLVYISQTGTWRHIPKIQLINLELENQGDDFLEVNFRIVNGQSFLYFLESQELICSPNIVIPILHGKNGEDGAIQGVLQSLRLAYTGSRILGAALSMDKVLAKGIVRALGIKVAKEIIIEKKEKERPDFCAVIKYLGLPFVCKPSSGGSSLGVTMVQNEKEYEDAIESAYLYGSKILLEEFIIGREVECAILGNHILRVSTVGEVTYSSKFYTYEAKYENKQSQIHIPASIAKEIVEEVQKCSISIFKALNCRGFSRVDFFLRENGDIIFNELNSIPGFTDKSMFPLLWKYEGLTQTELIEEIIKFGIEASNE